MRDAKPTICRHLENIEEWPYARRCSKPRLTSGDYCLDHCDPELRRKIIESSKGL